MRWSTCTSPAKPGSIGLDAPALAGSKTTPDMWEDKVIGPNPDGWGYFLQGKVNDAGYTSICTPGWVKGMAAILERYGTISWADAIAPAIAVAEDGWVSQRDSGHPLATQGGLSRSLFAARLSPHEP